MIFFSTPIWADDIQSLEAKVERQQHQIEMLEKRIEHDENMTLGAEGQIIGMIQNQQPTMTSSVNTASHENAEQAWNRIHAETQRNEIGQDIESNRNEIFRIEHGY